MKYGLLILLVLALVACSRPETTPVPAHDLSPEQMLDKIRAQSEVGNEVVFNALADEVILDLQANAGVAEAAGNYAQAKKLLDDALQVNPADPQVLQSRAELAIRDQAWVQAEQYARRSFDSGAKLGSLCRRNWLTMHYARMAQGRSLPPPQLAKNLNECTLVPPARL
jgi:tetratricopeptide (TPR) repeat protein